MKATSIPNHEYEIMTEPGFKNFNGIVSHVNCRIDKTDSGPAFEWNKIIL